MGKLILIYGALATMKTTLSKRIAKQLGLICLNKDDLKEILGDTIGFTNREENLKLSLATFEIMKETAEIILGSGGDVILESNFRHGELEKIYAMAKNTQTEVLSIILSGNPEVLYERYANRQEQRHPVHKSTGLLDKSVFISIIPDYDIDIIYGDHLLMDTTEFNETKYDRLVSTIDSFLSK